SIDYDLPSSLPFVNDEYDLLIICPEEWIDALQQLKQHKESHGIRTVIAGLNEIYSGKYFSIQGRDPAEKIKYFIKDAIEQWGIKYVMLVGDVEEMPVRYVATVVDEVPCDLYFADIYSSNGSFSSWDKDKDKIYGEKLDDRPDLYPDVYIGRLPAGDENELNLLINKIINYKVKEKNALMTGVELFWDTDNREGEYLKEEISKEMNIHVIKLYETDEYEKNDSATSYNIAKYINNGVMMVNFASHGSPYGMGWESGHFVIDDLNLLHNSYLPVVFAMSCSTNEFDTTDCLGEKFLTYENGGAIAYAGSSRVAYVYLGKSIKSSLSGYLDTAFFRAYYDGFNRVGEIFSEAKVDYITKHVFRNEHDYLTLVEYNLMGDPTIEIPSMPDTSKAYVSKSKSNSEIKIWVEVSEENISNASVDLYYRKKIMWGGRWYLYGSKDSEPYEWEFLPEEEGLYEFYSVFRKGNYSELAPRVSDAYCVFDFHSPSINITKPKEGGIYIFNREVLSANKNFTLVIGKIEVQAEGDVVKIEFYVDDKLMHIDYDSPFKWTWDEFSFGKHEIKVVGYDVVDNMAEEKRDVLTLIL
ncbi:MAG TPA: hypothetical protein ENI53_01430, partial [Thermoplasmatales archaeon]|nr:hypothetical protein [Thermoplasmatales archaeon]